MYVCVVCVSVCLFVCGCVCVVCLCLCAHAFLRVCFCVCVDLCVLCVCVCLRVVYVSVCVYTVLHSYSILSALDDTPNKETVIILQECMIKVWETASTTTEISLDQQHKLLDVLDTLSTKAIAVSPTSILWHVIHDIY